MLRIDVFLNLAKLPKRLPVKRKKVYGSLVKESVIQMLVITMEFIDNETKTKVYKNKINKKPNVKELKI